MFKFPFVLVTRTSLEERDEAIRSANQELQLCLSTLFDQRREYEEKLAHLAELLQGSTCTIGGIELNWKRGIDDV